MPGPGRPRAAPACVQEVEGDLRPVGVLEERRRLRGPVLQVKLLQSPVSLLQLLQDAVLLRRRLRRRLRRPLT